MEDHPDDENTFFVRREQNIDDLLAKFYGQFPWPWPPRSFDYPGDPDLSVMMLNQDIGDWTLRSIPDSPRIWVAGCGTTQAVLTALRFPKATVIGSDVSQTSIDTCAAYARQLDVGNLELRLENINDATYDEAFDVIISTGVVHHNAYPAETLKRLCGAVRRGGVLEIMVYNRYHRIVTSAFQKAIRLLGDNRGTFDFSSDLMFARKIVESFHAKEMLERAFIQYMDWSESDFADLLIQPVEHTYTVETLAGLAAQCGSELLQPCISLYVKSLASTIFWNMEFRDRDLQAYYDSMPDLQRWQATNLLMHEKSPLLWFYLQRKDSGRPRKTEAQISDEFLERRFVKNHIRQRSYLRGEDGTYQSSDRSIRYTMAADPLAKEVYEEMDGAKTVREVLAGLRVEPSFRLVNRLRIQLSTSSFPFLQAV